MYFKHWCSPITFKTGLQLTFWTSLKEFKLRHIHLSFGFKIVNRRHLKSAHKTNMGSSSYVLYFEVGDCLTSLILNCRIPSNTQKQKSGKQLENKILKYKGHIITHSRPFMRISEHFSKLFMVLLKNFSSFDADSLSGLQ